MITTVLARGACLALLCCARAPAMAEDLIPGVALDDATCELIITPTQSAGNVVTITEDDGTDLVVTVNGQSVVIDMSVVAIDGITVTASVDGGDVVENDSLVGMTAYLSSPGNTLVDTSDAGVLFYLMGDDESASIADSTGAIYVEGQDEVLSGTYAADIAIVEDGGTYTVQGEGTATTGIGVSTGAGSGSGSGSGTGSTSATTQAADGQLQGGGCGLGGGAALLVAALGVARRQRPR